MPIILKPTIPNNPDIPKAPSQVRISAYYDGSAVVLTSTVATMAEVVITDTESGVYCFNGLAALAPDFRCPVCPTTGSSITITVTVGSTVYEGTIDI